ncbi:MAG: hypothetical protein IJ493_12020 [Clostridia bacterium]|nr:hypothetical protein [Clostridia bacterium]
MEYKRICRRLQEGGIPLVNVRLCVPEGISPDADGCYGRAADAFLGACETHILPAARQARTDMGEREARRRWRSWQAELTCVVREEGKHAVVSMAATLVGGGVELAREEFEDRWEMT